MAEQWRILVIEGEEQLNKNMVNSLQKDGYIVRGVMSGGEAIRLLWSEEYDVVICSQQMPDADGFDLLQWMRNYCPHARMVMLGTSSTSNAAMRVQALEMGAASYLEKPLDLHALKEELRRILHSTGFSASLDSFDLLDVIQIMTMSRKSIALIVNTGLEEQGILRFQNGELIWAEYGMLRGEEAFYALTAHKNGTVAHHTWDEQITPNVIQPLSRLIFQALQYRSKYADAIQASSELEAIMPMRSMALPPLPSTVLPEVLQDLDDEDRPFQFATEELLVESSPASMAFERLNGQLGVEHTISAGFTSKEWWEPSQPSASMRAITPPPKEAPVQQSPESEAQNVALPSWLTEQPTSQHLPVLRSQTGQIPAIPKNWSPVGPTVPPQASSPNPATPPQAHPTNALGLPDIPTPSGAVWPDLALHSSEAGLRKIKPEEALYTGRQPVVRPGEPTTRSAPLAEWQEPEQATMQNGHSGSLRAVKPETLHSLAALKKPTMPLQTRGSGEEPSALGSRAMEERTRMQPSTHISSEPGFTRMITALGQSAKYNYPALAAALQTLGYAVPGFVASAVVSLDGTPIAQVTEGNLDISPVCTHASQVVRSALQMMQQGGWEPYEYTVMSSRNQNIVLRLIGNHTEIFQMLITTRETKLAESLDALANVEAAIAAAVR